MVEALLSIGELAFSGLLPSVRFSVGFYVGRAYSLVTSSIVLIVLLAETTQLHVRLAGSNAILQRERSNKLMNLEAMAASISHEIRQPRTAIAANSQAAREFIKGAPPDLDEALAALNDVISDGHRVDRVLQDIRVLFGSANGGQEQIDLNELALGALQAVQER